MTTDVHTILMLKENLTQRKQALYTTHQCPVISIQANVIREHRWCASAAYVVSVIHEWIITNMKVLVEEHHVDGLGYYVVLVIDDDPRMCKERLVKLESTHPCGRLVDCDVFVEGHHLSRHDIQRPQRQCLLCDDLAKVCMRTSRHSRADVHQAFESHVDKAIMHPQEMVRFALISECMVYPKFGLVTPLSRGRHMDMDITTFLKSIQALIPFFKQVALIDINQPYETIFKDLRTLGQTMESAMFKATQGVNTHKGAIFLFLCVMMAQRLKSSHQTLSESLSQLTQPVLDDFKSKATTHGLRQFKTFNTLGVRGFVTHGGEPLLSKALTYYASKPPLLDHQVNTLLLIMRECEDSTIIKQGGLSLLHMFQAHAHHAFENPSSWASFEQWCLKHSLSAGGAADILALVIYLHQSNTKGSMYDHHKDITSRIV